MVERSQHLGFALEPRHAPGVSSERFRQYFQRDVALQPGIAGAIHFAHAARADRREDLVGSESVPGSIIHLPIGTRRSNSSKKLSSSVTCVMGLSPAGASVGMIAKR